MKQQSFAKRKFDARLDRVYMAYSVLVHLQAPHKLNLQTQVAHIKKGKGLPSKARGTDNGIRVCFSYILSRRQSGCVSPHLTWISAAHIDSRAIGDDFLKQHPYAGMLSDSLALRSTLGLLLS